MISYYANREKKSIIVVETTPKGKGWYDIKIGDYQKKYRNWSKFDLAPIMLRYYPNYENIRLFSELSYHSGLNEKNKITTYGTEDYCLNYSSYTPIDTYKCEQPIISRLKREFGKPRKRITLLEWDYIFIDWIPLDNGYIELQIKHTKSNPFDSIHKDNIIFQSKTYKMKDKNKTIADFKAYVKKFERSKKQ